MQSFSLGGIGGEAVNDEILIISSHSLIRDMVKQLELNKTYTTDGGFLKTKEYYNDAPFLVTIPESLMNTLKKEIDINIKVNNAGDNIHVTLKNEDIKIEQEASSFPVKIEYGEGVVVDKTAYYKQGESFDVDVTVCSYDAMAEDVGKLLYVGITNKKANGISLFIDDTNVKRGKDILNTLLACYGQDAEFNKNENATNMLNFIDERLVKVKKELDDSESLLEQYKLENDLSDIGAEAKIILEANHQYRQSLLAVETQYSIISMVDSFMNSPENRYSLVPVTTGLPDQGAAEAINEYNQLLLERMRLLRTATNSNLTLRSLTAQIDAMRDNILNTVLKAKETSDNTREDLRKQEEEMRQRLRGFPEQERVFFDLKRDQLIKQELYTFLMQRREETAMALSSTMPKYRIVNSAYSLTRPIAPDKKKILIMALLLGFILPIVYLYAKETITNKFRTKEDLKRLTRLPLIGEIYHNSIDNTIALSSDNATSESFRLLRSALQFALPQHGTGVLLVTSADEGAGKSFVAANLAGVMAMMGRRTVLVDLNFRHTSVAECVGLSSSVGGSDFLVGRVDNEAAIGHPTQLSPNLDAISAGTITMNPSDLLSSNRLEHLIAALKAKYECVILDTASLNWADTFAITPFADATLLVCRANYTLQKCLSEVDNFVADGSLKNVLLVLNDTEEVHTKSRVS